MRIPTKLKDVYYGIVISSILLTGILIISYWASNS